MAQLDSLLIKYYSLSTVADVRFIFLHGGIDDHLEGLLKLSEHGAFDDFNAEITSNLVDQCVYLIEVKNKQVCSYLKILNFN